MIEVQIEKIQREFKANQQILRLLEATKSLSENIIDELPTIVVLSDGLGRILKANLAAQRLLQRTQDELLGENISEQRLDGDTGIIGDFIKDRLENHVSFNSEVASNGEVRHFVWNMSTVFRSGISEKMIHVLAGGDVTDAKKHFQKLAEVTKDLELAAAVQNLLLPVEQSRNESCFNSAYFYEPATQIGGDYFTTDMFENGGAMFLIGDVMGHGVASAMVTSFFAGCYDTLVQQLHTFDTKNISGMFSELDTTMKRSCRGRYAVSLAAIYLGPDGRTVEYFNAAAPPAMLMKKDGKASFLHARADPLGMEGHPFEIGNLQFEFAQGDRIFIYTDGCYEFRYKEDGRPYGRKRLQQLVTSTMDLPVATAAQTIGAELMRLRGPASAEDDDMTFALIEGK